MTHPQQSIQLYLKTFFENNSQIELITEAVQAILEQDQPREQCIVQAIHVIECATAIRFEPELYVILLRLYICLGSASNARRIWNKLSIKHIQWDSLSWLVDSYLPALTDDIIANEEFYDEAEREIPDSMITAFKQGTWSQIPRFAHLREAISTSFTRRI